MELLASSLASCSATAGCFCLKRRAISMRWQWPSATRTGKVWPWLSPLRRKSRICCRVSPSSWLKRHIWVSHIITQRGHSSRSTGVCTAIPLIQLYSHSRNTTRKGDSPKLSRRTTSSLAFHNKSSRLKANQEASSSRMAFIVSILLASWSSVRNPPSGWCFRCRSSNSAAPAQAFSHFQHASSGRQNHGRWTLHTWRLSAVDTFKL